MRVDAVFRNEEGTGVYTSHVEWYVILLYTQDNWHEVLRDPIQEVLKMLGDILSKLQKAIYFLFLQVHPCI